MTRFVLAMMALLSLASAASAQAPLPFVLKQVGPGVFAAIDGPEHKAGSNAGFVVGDDGVLVVDAFFNQEAARALVSEIRRLTPKPIRYVVNTHYHADHTGGDQVLRDAGAIIIAHRNVRGWVRTNNINLFGDRITPELKARIEALPLPDLVTDKDLIVWLGSRKVVVRTVLGHTGGDFTIFVPDCEGVVHWRHAVAQDRAQSDRRLGQRVDRRPTPASWPCPMPGASSSCRAMAMSPTSTTWRSSAAIFSISAAWWRRAASPDSRMRRWCSRSRRS